MASDLKQLRRARHDAIMRLIRSGHPLGTERGAADAHEKLLAAKEADRVYRIALAKKQEGK